MAASDWCILSVPTTSDRRLQQIYTACSPNEEEKIGENMQALFSDRL